MFQLPELPYPADALEPHISRETLSFHHGKHHATYVAKLNELLEGTRLANAPLEQVVRESEGAVFNNAAQYFNHSFYWQCLSPDGGEPDAELTEALVASFGSVDGFKEMFTGAAAGLFGSGWVWLARRPDGTLEITSDEKAGTPLTRGWEPLLTCDVWEHAYYLDYQNRRPAYIDSFWKLVNWSFVSARFREAGEALAASAR